MIFVIDAMMSPRFEHIIKAHDSRHEVRLIRREFPLGTPDIIWMSQLAEWHPRPYVVGADRQIFCKLHEREALRGSGLTFIYFDGWQQLAWQETHWQYLKHWPKVIQMLSHLSGPHLLRVKRDGGIRCDAL